jgi:hypothetical protein
MFSIELNPNQGTRQRKKAIAEQRQKMYELTDFECHVFGVFCESVGQPEMKEFAESFVRQRNEDDDDVYVGDKEIMETQGTLQHDSGGGKRNIRGTKSLS